MLKGKNKVTKENVEMYKELYQVRQTLTNQDIKKVLVRMGVTLSLGMGISCLFTPATFLFSFGITLVCTYGVVVGTVRNIIHQKEKRFSLQYPDLDISIDNEELLKQILLVVEQERRKRECRERQRRRSLNLSSNYITVDRSYERPKVLVKTLQNGK